MLHDLQCLLITNTFQASIPTHGNVASRVQAFQDGQSVRAPKSNGEVRSPALSTEIIVSNGRAKRANTTGAAPTYLPSIGEREGSPDGTRPKGDEPRHRSVVESLADRRYLNSYLPSRPATSFESNSPYQQRKAANPTKQSPERRNTHRRQSSLDTQSTTQNRLSEARARLRFVGEGTPQNPVEASIDMNVLPARQRTDIHELQDLIDDAIDEQSELDMVTSSKTQSPRLNSVATQIEMSTTSPSKRQSIDAGANQSPSRRGRSVCSSSRARVSSAALTNLADRDGKYPPLCSSQQTSPTRRQRLSTETVLPRSSTDSEPLVTPSCCPVYSSAEIRPGHEIFHLAPLLPIDQAPSPVKQKAAAFEKMMQHDKQILYAPSQKHDGKLNLDKPWWLESSDSRQANNMQEWLKQRPTAILSKAGRIIEPHPAASTGTSTPTPRSGPIPLALPQLISSRGRTVSASTQFEDSFETVPQSEAALSRLSTRVHSPRAIPRVSGGQDIGDAAKSPFFRWKPFMLDKTFPAQKTIPTSPPESTLEGNAGSDLAKQAGDTITGVQRRTKDLLQASKQDTASPRVDEQTTSTAVAQSKDVTHAPTNRSSTQETQQPQPQSSKRLSLRTMASTKPDQSSGDGVADPTTMAAQAHPDSAEIHHRDLAPTESRHSSNDIVVAASDDDDPAVAIPHPEAEFAHTATEEPGIKKTTTTTTSWQLRSQHSVPFPLMPVDEAAGASFSIPRSPVRGRTASRALPLRMGEGVRVSRSRSQVGNVRVTVEVRTPKGSPVKERDGGGVEGGGGDGIGVGVGERVVIVTTDVQGDEGEGGVNGVRD